MFANSRDGVIPPGACVRLVNVRSYVVTENGRDVIKRMPQFVQLDIWVDGKHLYRQTDVAVSKFVIYLVLGGGYCAWTLWLDMTDGFSIDAPAGTLTMHGAEWCWKD